jgi:hypothetical protein
MSWWSVIPVVGDIIDGVIDTKKAKVIGEIEVIRSAAQNVATWEQYMAKASSKSWKDEYWTIIWSIPLVMGFFPGMSKYTTSGFESFQLMPEWYQYTLVTMVLASFGIRMGTTVKGMLFK